MLLILFKNLEVWVKKVEVKENLLTTLSKAAAAIGVAGIFIETHDDPDNAPSDGPNMLNIE